MELLLTLPYQDVAVKERDNFKLGLLDHIATPLRCGDVY